MVDHLRRTSQRSGPNEVIEVWFLHRGGDVSAGRSGRRASLEKVLRLGIDSFV